MRPLDSLNRPLNFLILIISFSLLLISSCKDSTTDPPVDNKPPRYQEDIPWPSLAESPWPMYRCDPQNTGRSRYKGASAGIIEWSIDTIFNKSGAAIGPDSTIYFVNSTGNSGLYAMQQDGNVKWYFPFPNFTVSNPQSPIVSSDGTIYTTDDRKLYAINSDGTLKWEVDSIFTRCTGNTIGKDGTLYIYSEKDGGRIYSVSKNGNLNWSFPIQSTYGDYSSFALSPDSKTLYIIGTPGHYLAAIDLINVTIKWKVLNRIRNNPMVDSEGNIYVSGIDTLHNGIVYSVRSDGSLRWYFQTGLYDMHDLSIDRNGNIYFLSDSLFCLDYEGKLKWKQSIQEAGYNFSPVAIDRENNIFILTGGGSNDTRGICYNSSGALLWDHKYPEGLTGYTPVINFNGIIFLSYHDEHIMKLK